MRRLLRDIAEGRELGDVTTLRDPDVVAELDEVVKRRAREGDEESAAQVTRGLGLGTRARPRRRACRPSCRPGRARGARAR